MTVSKMSSDDYLISSWYCLYKLTHLEITSIRRSITKITRPNIHCMCVYVLILTSPIQMLNLSRGWQFFRYEPHDRKFGLKLLKDIWLPRALLPLHRRLVSPPVLQAIIWKIEIWRARTQSGNDRVLLGGTSRIITILLLL